MWGPRVAMRCPVYTTRRSPHPSILVSPPPHFPPTINQCTVPPSICHHHHHDQQAVRHVQYHRAYPLMASASDDGTVHVFHCTVYECVCVCVCVCAAAASRARVCECNLNLGFKDLKKGRWLTWIVRVGFGRSPQSPSTGCCLLVRAVRLSTPSTPTHNHTHTPQRPDAEPLDRSRQDPPGPHRHQGDRGHVPLLAPHAALALLLRRGREGGAVPGLVLN